LSTALEILNQYWGYTNFRSPQDKIIESVVSGKDTLVILPTGGGKSICYQVPALMQEGITIVISPLIALMKDQVERLQKQGIKAKAIFSGLTPHEIDVALDNAVYSDIKLLYVSPERIETEIFRTRVQKMNVNFIAIDEAHCISQWGYDFRPSYLKIAELRALLPKVPVIALTASATLKVRADIMAHLKMSEGNVFTQSFLRSNLSFVTRKVENKGAKLLEVLSKLGGSGIIYVRSRRKTVEIAEFLSENKYKATSYHAGLPSETRSARQESWMKGEVPIMVCTNAFGMGIDKPNVRFVIHWDVPNALEAYYQEAGRAGRDGKMSYAVLLYNEQNIGNLKAEVTKKFPELVTIKAIYNAICNHLKVATNNGFMMSYDFDIIKFSKLFKLNSVIVYNVIEILEQEGYWLTSQSMHLPSRLKFMLKSSDIYKFQVENEKFDQPIQLLLRTYGGILDHYIIISESYLADRIKMSVEAFTKTLVRLKEMGVVNYVPFKNNPTLTFLKNRVPDTSLILNREFWMKRKQVNLEQSEAMINYCHSNEQCKQAAIAAYFGETDAAPCGICSACIERKATDLNAQTLKTVKTKIQEQLKSSSTIPMSDLLNDLGYYEKQNYLKVIRNMLDEQEIKINPNEELSLG
jgi:ATP-dependent DNA helicase RecQ